MAVYYSTDNLPEFRNAVLTIGTFDGVHKGHQAILKDVVQQAAANDGESILITFEPHPRKLIYPDQSLQLLTPLEDKLALILKTGIRHIVVVPFDTAFASLSAHAYVADLLVKKFNPSCIVIGYDHHFGHDRMGNLSLLQEMSSTYRFKVQEIQAQKIDEAAVSSTKVRKALLQGDVATAQAMLGRAYSLKGTVVAGAQIGRQLGYPTANIVPADDDQLIPGNGVYAIRALYNGASFKGMLNIGIRPTVSETLKLHIEAHLFNFNQDIYDQELEISFVARLRDEQKFGSLDELKAQLAKDAEQAMAAVV
jgi:riboflavin kinase/FMN adenylyltransferase